MSTSDAPARLWPHVWRFHFFAGVLVGPFLAVLCLTGILYALAPQIDDVVYHRQLYVDHVGATPLPLARQVEAAAATDPHATVRTIAPAPAPDRTTAVTLSDGATVYVDPSTAVVRGTLTTENGRPPLQAWLRHLHGDLHLGDAGRIYSELAASWLPFLATGGVILWLVRRRRRRTPAPGARARTRAWHAAVGLGLLAGIAFISVTGLTWSHFAGDRFQAVVDALHGRTPQLAASVGPSPAGSSRIGPDQALATARAQGMVAPLELTPPQGPAGTWRVAETGESWPIHKDAIAIDPHAGGVVARLDFAQFPLRAKLTSLGIDAHQGTLFGLANQAALIAFALGLLFVIGAGYRMWWLRRPRGALLGRPPGGIPWQRVPRPALVAAAAAVVATGAVLPVFALSLLVFVALDSLGSVTAGRTT
jgi:uncharacterized iron-regulated membrane protein